MEKCTCWRRVSRNVPRGQKAPQTMEALQAAWERDQEVMATQQAEIGKLRSELNNLRQRYVSCLAALPGLE